MAKSEVGMWAMQRKVDAAIDSSLRARFQYPSNRNSGGLPPEEELADILNLIPLRALHAQSPSKDGRTRMPKPRSETAPCQAQQRLGSALRVPIITLELDVGTQTSTAPTCEEVAAPLVLRGMLAGAPIAACLLQSLSCISIRRSSPRPCPSPILPRSRLPLCIHTPPPLLSAPLPPSPVHRPRGRLSWTRC